uniref:Mechanosensitive ion channel protein n=3 Tax=Aplanochytrium stocchinoi TaxID=215587 RepID=A0A7S3PL29_9STRA|mmetsp:Transcript_895/g.1246  ORF Transcript_895/g.1246 Transcript_895/m.1246 type:complete len:722 (-) Transcript_895:737-2902(-)
MLANNEEDTVLEVHDVGIETRTEGDIKLDTHCLSKRRMSDSLLVTSPRPPKHVSNMDPQTSREEIRVSDGSASVESEDDDSNSEHEEPTIIEKIASCVAAVYGMIWTVLFGICSLGLLVTTIFFRLERPNNEWADIPVWQWTLYFALFFPSWLVAKLTVNIVMVTIETFGKCLFFTSDDQKPSVPGAALFLQRYGLENKLFVWSLLLTLAFFLCFGPAFGPEEHFISATDEWQDIYSLIVKLHAILVLYTLGIVVVDIIEFKYLHKFASRHLIEKIEKSLFQEVVLTALAGLKAYRASSLLSEDSSKLSRKTYERRAHVAIRYVLDNKLEHNFSIRMRLPSERRGTVVSALLKKINQNIRITRQKRAQRIRERLLKEHILTGDGRQNQSENPQFFSNVGIQKTTSSPQMDAYESLNSNTSSRRKAIRIPTFALEMTLQRSCPNLDREKAMEMLNPSHKGKHVTLQQLNKITVGAFDDRRHLIQSLKDSATVTAQIKMWIQIVANLVIVLITLMLMGINGVDLWVGFTTFLVGFSFVFGGAIKNAFENFLFLYGSHPFDVGDSILIGGPKQYTVERVLLQTTELNHFGEIRIVQNSVIRNTEPLINITRSKQHWVTCEYLVDASVITDDFVQSVQQDMETFFRKNSDDYAQYFRIDYFEFFSPEKVKLLLIFGYDYSLEQMHRSRVAQSKAAARFLHSLQNHGAKYSVIIEYSENAGIPRLK